MWVSVIPATCMLEPRKQDFWLHTTSEIVTPAGLHIQMNSAVFHALNPEEPQCDKEISIRERITAFSADREPPKILKVYS